MANEIEIFRTGTHSPLKGAALTFGVAELEAIAASYDPASYEAPIVVGHPALDAPAYGWIASLRVNGDRLLATPKDVDVQFAAAVREKKYKRVSASFWPPVAPNNPTPGKWALKHVGFLGAAAPAVKGLKPAQFADDDGALEFADWQTVSVVRSMSQMFARLRDWIVDRDGLEQADKILPDWQIDGLKETVAGMGDDLPAPAFAAPTPPEENPMTTPTSPAQAAPDAAEIARREQALAAREAAFAEREAAVRNAERRLRHDEDAAAVAAAVEGGRLPMGLAPLAVAIFADLGDEVVAFGEGDDADSASPRDLLRRMLAALPQPVTTGELAGGDLSADFADGAAWSAAIGTEIEAARGRGEVLSPADAAMRIQHRQG